MNNINYISNGKWYIQSHRDLYAVYHLLEGFYCDTLMPVYGESYRYRLVYNKDLQMLKVVRYDRYSLRGKAVMLSLLNSCDLQKRVQLLFDSIVAMGIVNAPFYSVDITFKTSINDVCNMKKNYLISSGGLGRNKGYFCIKGKIY